MSRDVELHLYGEEKKWSRLYVYSSYLDRLHINLITPHLFIIHSLLIFIRSIIEIAYIYIW